MCWDQSCAEVFGQQIIGTGVIPADEEIFLPDRVHLNFKGTKKLADYVADHLSKCKAARNALARKRRRRPACAREVLYDNAEML